MTDDTTVPRETVVQIAKAYNELMELKARQADLMAQMIRGCIAKLRQSADDTRAMRQACGFAEQKAARVLHQRDQAKAWLYLDYVATQLENQSVRLPDANPKDIPICFSVSDPTTTPNA